MHSSSNSARPPGRDRRAFTLVELLVVVAIIGILVALLLPAVQAAREAARRASCSNNLVQLVMAVHQYEATHEVYPPGTVNATGPIRNQWKGYHHGWIEQLLPFLEKEAIYHRIDRDVSVYDKVNAPIRKVGISMLSCPSNWQNGNGYSNYAAVHHDIEAPIDTNQHGVFFLNSAVARDDVRDGVGYTLFLGEKISEPGDLGWLSGTRAILRNTGEPVDTAIDQTRGRRWYSLPTYPPSEVDVEPLDEYGMGTDMSDLRMYAEVEDSDETLDDTPADVGDGSTPAVAMPARGGQLFVGGFASDHPGGGNFAMGDGSIRFLASTMSMPVYQQLGHRADGELVDLE